MLLRPTYVDLRVIAYYCGRLMVGLGWIMLIPLAVAIVYTEINPALIFVISSSISLIFGYSLMYFFHNTDDLKTMHSMLVVGVAWLIASFLGAIPLMLSGHFLSFLDAYFEAVSAFTTSGLSLAVDLEHMPASINFWRHLMMFLGGQGIVVVALTILGKTAGGIYGLYSSEGKEEKIVPNVVQTARFIWVVSLVYLVVATTAMTLIMYFEGMHLGRSIVQSASLFMAAYDTGGFAPHSQNILYYHSAALEGALMFIMVVGCINFGVHFAFWKGRFSEAVKNIELIMFAASVVMTYSVLAYGMALGSEFLSRSVFYEKTFFQLLSAHTGTGFSTVYPSQLTDIWAPISFVTLIVAMALGGSLSSTSGGIKALRIALVLKLLKFDIKRAVMPPAAVLVVKYHHLKDIVLTGQAVRNALLIIIAYITTFLAGALIGMYFGNSFSNSLFESVSAAANVGLSSGITTPDMPAFLKLTYIFEMWVGRLEFLSIFALMGLIWALVKGK